MTGKLKLDVQGKHCDKYRKTAVLKVETDIITSIKASLIGQAVILVVMYVETFKTDVIVLSYNVSDITLTDDFQFHLIPTISLNEISLCQKPLALCPRLVKIA